MAYKYRYKRGDPHPTLDGIVFYVYHKSFKSGEYWVTEEKFKELNESHRKDVKKWLKSEKGKAYMKEYKKTEKYLQYRRDLYQKRLLKKFDKEYNEANSKPIQ